MFSGLNRRKFPRANYPCQIVLSTEPSSEPIRTVTENIGAGGLACMVQRKMDQFSPISFMLHLPDQSSPVSGYGTVAWAIERREFNRPASPTYDTGIEFTSISPQDKSRIQKIVDRLHHTDADGGERLIHGA